MHLMRLLEALEDQLLDQASAMTDINITGIAMDSRKVEEGNLFVAISGYEMDGHKYIQDAVNRGAAAIISEKSTACTAPLFRVKNSRVALGKLASAFYDFPSRKHKVIGITGTNGKTSTSYLLKHILESAGKTCSLIGTVSYMINDEIHEPTNTTPNALHLQQLLSKSEDEFFIMEISSHALKQARVEGVELDYGLFTNLSHDHLDYHDSMEQYFEDKSVMFNYLKKDGKAIINQICPWGQRLSGKIAHIPMVTLGEKDETQAVTLGEKNDIQAVTFDEKEHLPMVTRGGKKHDCVLMDVQLDGKINFMLKHGEEHYKIFFPIPGLHNVYNAAMAFLTAVEIGIDPHEVVEALASFPGAPGRFEMVEHPAGATFIVDYAHTKDAFELCLQGAKQQGAKRITHIFGFRGARDPSKREDMVKASAGLSDSILLTLDDLNGVSELEISEELTNLNLNHGQGKGKVILDRTLAIQEAWEKAEKDEWVFITGKGPESYEREYTLPVTSDKEAVLFLKKENQQCEEII